MFVSIPADVVAASSKIMVGTRSMQLDVPFLQVRGLCTLGISSGLEYCVVYIFRGVGIFLVLMICIVHSRSCFVGWGLHATAFGHVFSGCGLYYMLHNDIGRDPRNVG